MVFVLLSGTFFEALYKFPTYTPRLVHMVYAVPFGLLGGVVGVLFMLSLARLQNFFLRMKGRVVLRGPIVALGMAMALLFPGFPVAVIVAATVAGALVAALRAPLFAELFTLALVQKETAAVIAVAVVFSALLTALLALRAALPVRNNLFRK